MKTKLKIAGIVLGVLIVVMLLFAMVGLQEALNLKIRNVELTAVPDGVYTGVYDNGRFSNTVTVTVADHHITAIDPAKNANGSGQTAQTLLGRVIDQQRTDVDAVAGATATSLSLLKAVENALTGATAN